jgi:hypothetical protein
MSVSLIKAEPLLGGIPPALTMFSMITAVLSNKKLFWNCRLIIDSDKRPWRRAA